ncbi:MAG: hypothetical protein KJ755_13010 [Alphaproteobacteria bacterium]|jgi:hypothetical protein|uniref:Uncharacterized protein n=1 Tax=Qipengyuania benthica TaxID=3067651 RepID=A0ABT9H6Q7_9SPHN|nr:hypothetical protein [Qipengyuania sp. DY56-A-20]MBU2328255.1 hypothetical protein [Alphaproteobacteria bacterium]MDP4539001.1 hypothetical protein [Qipengyuania sp. DY56-A-20]
MAPKLARVIATGLALTLGVSLPSGSALARDLKLTEPGIPYAYLYGACVFEPSASRAADCDEVRKAIESEAEITFDEWHRGSWLRLGRQFARALDLIDAEAAELAAAEASVPAPIISYMHCLGKSISNDPSFIEGSSADYISIEPACADRVDAENGGSDEWRGHYLYHRLRREGRVLNSAQRAPSTLTYRYGLLDLRRLDEG